MSNQIIVEVRTFKIEQQCTKCKKGYMRPDPSQPVQMTDPPIYPHKCTQKGCNNVDVFNETYPALAYRDIKGRQAEGSGKKIIKTSTRNSKKDIN